MRTFNTSFSEHFTGKSHFLLRKGFVKCEPKIEIKTNVFYTRPQKYTKRNSKNA